MSVTDVRILATRHAFSEDVRECRVERGLTIREIVGDCGDALAITLDGEPIAAEAWPLLCPLPGATLTVVPLPRGDPGDLRNALLMIALIAAAAYAGPAIAGVKAFAGSAILSSQAFWTSTVYAVGSLDVNALVREARPKAGGRPKGNLANGYVPTGSNSAARTVARLKRDRPDLAA